MSSNMKDKSIFKKNTKIIYAWNFNSISAEEVIRIYGRKSAWIKQILPKLTKEKNI